MNAPFVFVAMGTVVSLQSAREIDAAAQDAVITAFVELEERFSLWREDTEASRLSRRELPLTGASDEFRAVYDEAVEWRRRTEGAFTPHRPDGAVDLSGVVKALAIRNAGRALDERGLRDWCLNAGGDVLVDGTDAGGRPWVVGIVDPDDRTRLLTEVRTGPGRRAVATSGIAERGEHVWRIGADDRFTQVTVVADDIVTADVWATAVLAGGLDTLRLAEASADLEVMACGATGECFAPASYLYPPVQVNPERH